MKNSQGFNLISVIIIICVTSIASAITSGVIVSNNYGLSLGGLSDDKALTEFLKTYSRIVDNYYEDIDKEKMLDSALNGMLDYLGDNYTTYLNEAERKELEERLSGTYEGVGIHIIGNEIIKTVIDSPAEKAGILAGDKIIAVNDYDVADEPHKITVLINRDKNVNLKVLRGEEELSFNLQVATIEKTVVDYVNLENNIGYLKIDIFSKNLGTQVKRALTELEANGMQKLIIDLRDNSGGYLESAEDVASLFLEKGKLVYSLKDKNNKKDYYDKTDESRNYPILILLNGESASSAEILASALKDSYGAVFVGEKSFGKGKVQQTYELGDGSMAKYTSALWLRPNGNCIDGIGLVPDYESTKTTEKDEYGNDVKEIDNPLLKAIEVISSME